MKQGTQLDFSGQTIFVGMDVHKKSWKVCIRSEQMELKTFSQEPFYCLVEGSQCSAILPFSTRNISNQVDVYFFSLSFGSVYSCLKVSTTKP
ncbi:MAG: Transposase family protein [Mucilaginibacter sp.]|nr:Transposase family protein [Mucilaginibacter sp.]